ncbi:MAG: ATP synthase F1 subunit delta [Verrucomicrobia bacterium]|nr:ATP synthase F1 subunit delta [Verrucomicrobiota bacterium]MCG2680969.1 ATP synthase F1 subunit delta [Kiritimatiellia bacterium]MBU4248140.1 ATP synthase F1 subunit delta [Verrucomicrobiota bacterium]MBU4290277.1 ATP synthase F1 subunit delta [Verrucomicrobiota bacterium]MBU4428710.1 ATP synthase F1 subunit delta [Verrucomicrobiota bacterium]
MASNQLVHRYAQAVFSLAQEHGLQDRLAEELNSLDRLLEQNRELRECLQNPFIPGERKLAVIADLFTQALSPLTRDFLRLLIEKRRVTLLADMTRRINALLRESLGILPVHLTSAQALNQEQEAAIRQRLARLFNRKVEMNTTVDASLLGGIMIQTESRLIDGSCRGQLDNIRYELSLN